MISHKETHSATRLLLKSTASVSKPIPYTYFSSILYFLIHLSSNLMPLVRSQEDEFHNIESEVSATSIGRWRVSTHYSQRSHGLRSSLKPASLNPRSRSKAASWMTAAHHVARLESIQEDEDDGNPAHEPQLPQISMETDVRDPRCTYCPGLLMYTPGSDG